MSTHIEGQIAGVFVGRQTDSLVTTREPEAKVTLEGFVGDNHAGYTRKADSRTPHFPRGTIIRNSRQVSIVSLAELAETAVLMNLPQILPEWLGANLLFTGITSLTFLPQGTRLFFPGETVLVVEGENAPCTGPGRVIQEHYPDITGLISRFPKAAWHRRGLVAWVERPGLICEGGAVKVELAPKVMYSY